MLMLGTYPTPVEQLRSLSTASTALWVKRDDLTHPTYGGNKLRKLEYLLSDARERHATQVVTVGHAMRRVRAWVAAGAYFIPAGGSNRVGTLGMVDAGLELAAQVRSGELPAPDLIVVPLGS